MVVHSTPEGIPILSRGKHHSPRRGACFMEMASVLAGEPWSDKPRCTHPLLAHLARMVNDCTSDAGRGALAPHIPSVVGLRGGGLAWEVSLVTGVAAEAISDVPERFQRVLAVGLLRCEELAASFGPEGVESLGDVHRAMAEVPHAAAWARRFADGIPLKVSQFRKRSAPHLLTCSVQGIVAAAGSDTDERLHHLLTTAIDLAGPLRPSAPADRGTPPGPAGAGPRDRQLAPAMRH